MKQLKLTFLLIVFMSMVGVKTLAYSFSVANGDGVIIYYNYINNSNELEVAHGSYSGSVVIPEKVTYMNRTRYVTSIGEYNQEIKGETNVEIISVSA